MERGGWCLIVGGGGGGDGGSGGGGDGDVAWYTAAWVQRGARRVAHIMRGKGSWLLVVGKRREKEDKRWSNKDRRRVKRARERENERKRKMGWESETVCVTKVRTYDRVRRSREI